MEKKEIKNIQTEEDFDFNETVCSPEFQEGCKEQPETEENK